MSTFNTLLHGETSEVAALLGGDNPPDTLQDLRAALTNALDRIDRLESKVMKAPSDLPPGVSVFDEHINPRHTLPPDPDGQNDDRAAWAAGCLSAFQRRTGSSNDDAVSDLLTDLMHFCDRREGLPSFQDELDRATRNYKDETSSD